MTYINDLLSSYSLIPPRCYHSCWYWLYTCYVNELDDFRVFQFDYFWPEYDEFFFFLLFYLKIDNDALDDVRASFFLELIALHSRTLCMTRELHGPVSLYPPWILPVPFTESKLWYVYPAYKKKKNFHSQLIDNKQEKRINDWRGTRNERYLYRVWRSMVDTLFDYAILLFVYRSIRETSWNY